MNHLIEINTENIGIFCVRFLQVFEFPNESRITEETYKDIKFIVSKFDTKFSLGEFIDFLKVLLNDKNTPYKNTLALKDVYEMAIYFMIFVYLRDGMALSFDSLSDVEELTLELNCKYRPEQHLSEEAVLDAYKKICFLISLVIQIPNFETRANPSLKTEEVLGSITSILR